METIPAKTIITKRQDTSWFGSEYNMNLYKGCSHGCIYCDSRSDCYQIVDFDRVRVKENAIAIVQEELRKKTKTGVIGTGSMSDPYNPYEEKYQLTRQALELIDTYHFGAAIATKSDLLARDADILKRIQTHSPVICKITITTFDDALCRKLEPCVCTTSKRFAALQTLYEAGIFAGILMMPLLPGLTDTIDNITSIIHRAQECGAKFIYPLFGLTLRNGQREYYYRQLNQLFPGQNLIQSYQKQYGYSYECHSPNEKQLEAVFIKECNRLGLLYRMEDIIKAYKKGYEYQQFSLFS